MDHHRTYIIIISIATDIVLIKQMNRKFSVCFALAFCMSLYIMSLVQNNVTAIPAWDIHDFKGTFVFLASEIGILV